MDYKKIEKAFNKVTKSNQIHEATLLVENSNGDFSYSTGYGNRNIDSLLVMASITKLFTTTCILILQEKGCLSFNDKLSKFFNKSELEGLIVIGDNDYSFDLTISDLLFQVSGLPDSFEEGGKMVEALISQNDSYVTFQETLKATKALKPQFIPRTGSKAYYSNINFELLGEIIEKITQTPLNQIYKQFIFDPLALSKTYLPLDNTDIIPEIYYKRERLHRPLLIMSSRASGGCISTTKELMVFLKAFWNGTLFNKSVFKELAIYRKVQSSKGPINYGGGYMQIPLNGAITFFMGKGELLGHSGSTGSFAFYYPQKDLFFVGDVNQMANPAIPIRLSIQLAMLAK